MQINNIYLGNALEILKTFPDQSVDMILTDPPYGISQKGRNLYRRYDHYYWKQILDITLDFGEWDHFRSLEEYYMFTEQWFKECIRILKNKCWMYVFFAKEKLGLLTSLADKYGVKTRTIYVWCKTNPVPSFRKVNWISATEFCWVGSKGECKLKNYKMVKEMYNYFLYPNKSAWGKTKYAVEKPIALFKHLIEVNTNEGEIVLDPFIGTGTTAIACILSGRQFIGIEQDEQMYNIALERIKNCRDDFLLKQFEITKEE